MTPSPQQLDSCSGSPCGRCLVIPFNGDSAHQRRKTVLMRARLFSSVVKAHYGPGIDYRPEIHVQSGRVGGEPDVGCEALVQKLDDDVTTSAAGKYRDTCFQP